MLKFRSIAFLSLLLMLIPGANLYGAGDRVDDELKAWLKTPHERLHIALSCEDDNGYLQVELFGSGVGIWKGELQFQASSTVLGQIVESILEAGLPDWKPEYGREIGGQAAVRMICRIQVEVNAAHKSVVQYEKGKRFEELFGLAETIFERIRPLRDSGISAVSLRDGLEKVHQGTLAPQVVEMVVHWKRGQEESVLRLKGPRVEVESPGAEGGSSGKETALLSAGKVREVAGKLAALDFWTLPRNIDVADYTVVQVRILNHRHSVQGRNFAGNLASQDPDAKRRLSELREYLLTLARTNHTE